MKSCATTAPSSVHVRTLALAAVLLGSTLPTVAQEVSAPAAPPDLVRTYRETHGARILASFVELLSIPNVASDPEGIRRNADFLRDQLEQRGAAAELWRLPDAPPIVFGRIEVGAPRTLGFYVHYDGQPVDPDTWRTPPWSPTLYTAPIEAGGRPRPLPSAGDAIDPEWRLYGRSTGDDKAPLAAIFAALDALAEGGVALTSNLVFLFEGEEEAGSDHLGSYLRDHRDQLQVDLWLICDGPVHQSRRPQLVFGVRGYAGLDITVYGASRYLHSGHYGNWAPNPAQRLAHLLATLKDDDGRVLVEGFYDSTEPLSAAELQAMASLPDIDDQLREELGLAATEAGNAPLAQRLLIPSLNIRGLASAAVGAEARNIIPTTATASLDLRLVRGNDPDAMLDLLEAHIRRQGYHLVRQDPSPEIRREHPKIARVERRSGYPAARTPMGSPLVSRVISAARTAAGEPPVLLPTLGGSLPLYLFTDQLQAPLVITPIANHDDNQHAPDENLRLANLWYGIDLMAELFTMPPANPPDPELQTLLGWMSGSFASGAQATADPERYLDIRLAMVPIWPERLDGPWIYVEQAAAAHRERPYRQRVYRLVRQDPRTLRSDVFTLPGDALSWAGSWRAEHPLSDLEPMDLNLRQGCAVFLRRTGEGSFAGSTRGRECSSSLPDAVYATSEVIITPGRLISWDRGFNAQGDQVWGAETGPYVFLELQE